MTTKVTTVNQKAVTFFIQSQPVKLEYASEKSVAKDIINYVVMVVDAREENYVALYIWQNIYYCEFFSENFCEHCHV